MKPIFQNGRNSRPGDASSSLNRHSSKLPVTDWSFHTAAANLRGGVLPFYPDARKSTRGPGFHTLSQGFFATEAGRESRFEGAVFSVIVALSTWPIVLAIRAAIELSR